MNYISYLQNGGQQCPLKINTVCGVEYVPGSGASKVLSCLCQEDTEGEIKREQTQEQRTEKDSMYELSAKNDRLTWNSARPYCPSGNKNKKVHIYRYVTEGTLTAICGRPWRTSRNSSARS